MKENSKAWIFFSLFFVVFVKSLFASSKLNYSGCHVLLMKVTSLWQRSPGTVDEFLMADLRNV